MEKHNRKTGSVVLKEPKSKAKRRRKAAGSGDLEQRVAIPTHLRDNPEYVYRFANGYGVRTQTLYEKDWDFADIKGNMVDRGAESVHSIHTGTNPDNTPQLQYLMRKPRELYDADKAEDQAKIDEDMNQRQQELETPSDVTRYKPKGQSVRLS